MTNRERLLQTAEYDMLLAMQRNLNYCREHDEPHPCIMHALGENFVGLRCMRRNGKCEECIRLWLNGEARDDD